MKLNYSPIKENNIDPVRPYFWKSVDGLAYHSVLYSVPEPVKFSIDITVRFPVWRSVEDAFL